MSFAQLFKKLWPYLTQHKMLFASVVVVVLAYTAVGRLLAFVFGAAIDHGIKDKSYQVLMYTAFAFLALELLRSFLTFAQSYWSRRLGNQVLFSVRDKVISHVQKLPISYFDKNPIGRTVTRVTNDVLNLGSLFNEGFTSIFVNCMEIITILVALTYLSLPLTLATIFILPIAVWMTWGISQRLRYYFSEGKRQVAEINAYTSETINGIKVLQVYNQAKDRVKRFQKLSEEYRKTQIKAVHMFARLWPVLGLFNATTVATALIVGGLYYTSLGLSVGDLSAFILLLQGFFRPIRTILERYNQFQDSLTSAERVFQLLDEKEESQEGDDFLNTHSKGALSFKNVNFSYPDQKHRALKDFNLEIQAGQSVALVGRTGSGKTTTISLLQRFYNYQEGEIRLDGQEISKLKLSALRSRIGVVQQDNFIFRGSFASNIRLGDDSISDTQILQAVKQAHCMHLIENKAEGLHFFIEERGANLSLGEKQLIAFARVLAHKPDILILDEATANIDSQSELLIQKATANVTKNRTSLIIAHRLSTIVDCDLIVVLDQGRLVEQGTHSELLSLGGYYSQLYHAQYGAKQKNSTFKPAGINI